MATLKASATMRKGGKTSWFTAIIKPKISTTTNSTKISGTIQLTSDYTMNWSSGKCNLQYKLSSNGSYKDGDDLTIPMTGSTSKKSDTKSFSITIDSVLKDPTIYFRLDLTRTSGSNGQSGIEYVNENTNWINFTFQPLDFETKTVSSPPDMYAYVNDNDIYVEGDTYTSITNNKTDNGKVSVQINWKNAADSNDPVHVEINYKSRGIDTSGFNNEEFVGWKTIFGSASSKISTNSNSYNLSMIPGRRYSIRIRGTSYNGDSDKTPLYIYVSCARPTIKYNIKETGLDYMILTYESTGDVISSEAIDTKGNTKAAIDRLCYRINNGNLQTSKNSSNDVRNGEIYIQSLKPNSRNTVSIYGISTTLYNEKNSDNNTINTDTHKYNRFDDFSKEAVHGTPINIPIYNINKTDPMKLRFYIVANNTSTSKIIHQVEVSNLTNISNYTLSLSDEVWDNIYKVYNDDFNNIYLYGSLYMVSTKTGKEYTYLDETGEVVMGTTTPGKLLSQINFTGIQKTTRIKVDGEWKRAQAWVKVDGEWKRAIPWIKKDGEWKRTL